MNEFDGQTVEKPTMWNKVAKGVVIFVLGLGLLLTSSILLLRWVNPPVTAFILQEDWEELETERYSLRGPWVEYEDLPEHLKWAVVAAEDQRFWDHWGLDIDAIEVAIEERVEEGRQRGASTISQQVAKNLFLTPTQSFIRKGVEAGITVIIELFWPKERILEVYLNIAEFGPGVFGVGKAAEIFFGVHASQLVPDQSARLAAVLPSPKRMRVQPPSPYTQERSRWILRQMRQLTGRRYMPEPEPEADPPTDVPDTMDVVPELELMTPEEEIPNPEVPDSVDEVEPLLPGRPEPDSSSTDSLSIDESP